jgi:sigma-B regulation protein RsbU (phosphoserine phosphatase)
VQHASVPIRNGDEILGILNVATNEFVRLTPPQIQLLATIGALLGTAIARMRLYEQVKVRRAHEQRTLFQLSQELLGASSLEPALERLVRVGARLLEADACAFIEADEQQGCAILLAAHGWRFLPPNGLPVVLDPANPHLWYLPERSTALAEDALDTLPPLLQAQEFHGHLALAVTINGVPVGTFLVNTRAHRHFLDDEAHLFGLLSSQLAQTLERERLHQESIARHRLEQELDLARDIQASFLPASTPMLHGYTLARFYRPARARNHQAKLLHHRNQHSSVVTSNWTFGELGLERRASPRHHPIR